MQPMTERPPYVEFEQRPVERRSETGEVIYYTVDFALITPHGSRDRVEREAVDWLRNCDDQARAGRMPQEWARQFRGAFEEWKKTGEIPIDGTPLVNWPVLTKAELKKCIDLKLRSVEDLAQANEETVHRLGMGGRSLKQRANDWVEAQKGTGGLVSQLEALRQSLAAATTRLEALESENKMLKASTAVGPQQARYQEPPQQAFKDLPGLVDDGALVDSTIDNLLR